MRTLYILPKAKSRRVFSKYNKSLNMQKRKTSMMVLQSGARPGVCEEEDSNGKLIKSFTGKSVLLPLVMIIHCHIPYLRLHPLSSIEYFALISEDQS